ncbi:uncharacterized protein PHALS_04623 [Plasmopara halstedii]|uniref:Uncharacterized protein n=1 Tax=Plasmopara halstedii TaxID=4781 RepID=A0A0P1AA64_PLAHL|nr:uncharacterized protein PHALS_04623 [Plasmopara halstedii]CEG37176.1 hypothetical protein PHALS_04623 [Plasmopara halstedii]|eukprot:XP_024573545.1 hypothetical protein PHALS_04623 [Plasmopara halstedii]
MMGELGKVIKQNWLDGSRDAEAQQVLRRHTNQTEWQCAKPLRLKFSFDTASKSPWQVADTNEIYSCKLKRSEERS